MIADIEAGLVKRVIIKDMSRLGRDYLQVGMYTEIMFPEHDIHFIAVNDGVDSTQGDNEFTPFRNIINVLFCFSTVFANGVKAHSIAKAPVTVSLRERRLQVLFLFRCCFVESNIICRENRNGFSCIIFLSGGRRKEVKALNGYSYLTLEQRREIERMYTEGERVVDIAARLKRSVAAIYAELKRGYTGEFDSYARHMAHVEGGEKYYIRKEYAEVSELGKEVTPNAKDEGSGVPNNDPAAIDPDGGGEAN